MLKAVLLLTATLLNSAAATHPNGDKLHFVYELTRHGARAPSKHGSVQEGFNVAPGMLTPSGMRQRYLLGKYNMRKYSEEYDLLDVEDGPEQVLMMSTIVNRTMQSGYSEYLGMFPPGSE